MKYGGIDLHSNSSLVTVTDEVDGLLEEKQLPNDLVKILELLDPWREELGGGVVESALNCYWLVAGLQAANFTVHLRDATASLTADAIDQMLLPCPAETLRIAPAARYSLPRERFSPRARRTYSPVKEVIPPLPYRPNGGNLYDTGHSTDRTPTAAMADMWSAVARLRLGSLRACPESKPDQLLTGQRNGINWNTHIMS